MYKISNNSYIQAEKLGVKIKPSTNPKKKIDIFDYHNNFICSIGLYGISDYNIYLETKGKKYADERKRLYRLRHSKDINKLGSPGYYANKILWT
jgi:hypothetical protein